MNEYNKEACELRKQQVNDKLKQHDEKLDKQDDKIDNITKILTENSEQIKNLCKSVDGLANSNKWFIGFSITTLVGLLIKILVG